MRRRMTTAVIFGLVFIALVSVVRYTVAIGWNYGPSDIAHFSSRAYGSEIDRDTHPFFLTWIRGDGQAFLTLAADLDVNDTAEGIGNVSYRYSRIGPSLVAHVVALGNHDRLPEALAFVSLVSYGALGFVAAGVRDRLGNRALLLMGTPAPILGAVFDTAEAAGAVLLVLALTSRTKRGAIIWSGMLGITRPSYSTALPAGKHGLLATGAAITAGVALQAFVVFGLDTGYSGGASNLGLPLVGLINSWASMTFLVRIVTIGVMAMSAALLVSALDSSYTAGFRLASAASGLLPLLFGNLMFLGPLSLLRATGALPILLILAPLYEVGRGEGRDHAAASRLSRTASS